MNKTISMKYASPHSRYCYKGTDVLRNKFNIMDDELLREAESLFTAQRLFELQLDPVKGDFSLEHLQKIHYFIFQDIYEFAGKLREEDISKGSTLFAKHHFIAEQAEHIFTALAEENCLNGLSRQEFANRAAHYMAELNILHPFREGNGRVIREFIRCLARNAGYQLSWRLVDSDRLYNASVRSVLESLELADCIRDAIEDVIANY